MRLCRYGLSKMVSPKNHTYAHLAKSMNGLVSLTRMIRVLKRQAALPQSTIGIVLRATNDKGG